MKGIPIFPTINASLNALAGIFLFMGWRAIKAENKQRHRIYMILAFGSSILFLISYVTYHALIHGVTRYQGRGILRPIYFFILLTHTPLAIVIVPFSVAAIVHASRKNFASHVRLTRWLWPTWMYVSVTGVVIYLMLYIF